MFLLLPQAAPLESVYQRALKHSSIRDLIASSAAAATEVCNEQQHLLLRLNLPKVTVLADDRFYAERYLKLIRGLQGRPSNASCISAIRILLSDTQFVHFFLQKLDLM